MLTTDVVTLLRS